MTDLTEEFVEPDNELEEDCELIHETDRAWLIRRKGREAWFPKSRCFWHEEDNAIEYPPWLDPQWS